MYFWICNDPDGPICLTNIVQMWNEFTRIKLGCNHCGLAYFWWCEFLSVGMNHQDDVFLRSEMSSVLRAAVYCAQKQKILHEVVLYQMRKLLPAPCMFNRRQSLSDPLSGQATVIDWRKVNRPYGGFSVKIIDDADPARQPLPQSQIVLKWLQAYAKKREVNTKVYASGWQEVLIQIDQERNDDDAWLPLSTLLPSGVRQLKEDVVFLWLTVLCPVPSLALKTSTSISSFIHEALSSLRREDVKEAFVTLQPWTQACIPPAHLMPSINRLLGQSGVKVRVKQKTGRKSSKSKHRAESQVDPDSESEIDTSGSQEEDDHMSQQFKKQKKSVKEYTQQQQQQHQPQPIPSVSLVSDIGSVPTAVEKEHVAAYDDGDGGDGDFLSSNLDDIWQSIQTG